MPRPRPSRPPAIRPWRPAPTTSRPDRGRHGGEGLVEYAVIVVLIAVVVLVILKTVTQK